MFNFPKNCEWILNKYIYYRNNKGKVYYELEIWYEGYPDKTIAYLREPTLKGILKKIERLACRKKLWK